MAIDLRFQHLKSLDYGDDDGNRRRTTTQLHRITFLQSRASNEAGRRVRTILAEAEVFGVASEFVQGIGQVPVRTSDRTGFIVNRLLVPYMLDSIGVFEEGVASIVDIDTAMKLGCGYPMGPLTLGDFVGLDTT